MTTGPPPSPPSSPSPPASWAANVSLVFFAGAVFIISIGFTFGFEHAPPQYALGSPQPVVVDYSNLPMSPSDSVMRVIVITPENTPTPFPIGWQTATKEAELTATATMLPQPCPLTKGELDAMTPGTLCKQPTATPVPAITSTPLAGCDPEHWVVGELCKIGAPFLQTPTPWPFEITATAESLR